MLVTGMLRITMQNHSRYWLVGFLCCIFLIVPFIGVLAQDFGLTQAQNIGGNAFGGRDIRDIIVNVVNIALGFLGILAVIIILYGGWLWMTSGGNAEKVDLAKKTLRNALIGLFIILASYAIANFFFSRFSGGTRGGPPGDVPPTGSGVLGGGIIESVYPPPGAGGIPRDVNIFCYF